MSDDQQDLALLPRAASLDGFVKCACGSYDVAVLQDRYRRTIRCTCSACGSDITFEVGDTFGDRTVVHRAGAKTRLPK